MTQIIQIELLDARIRDVCPIDGVASTRRVDIQQSATQPEIDEALLIAEGWETLLVSQTKSLVAADGIDSAIITINGLVSFSYVIWDGFEPLLAGSIIDGTLEFTTDTAGLYLIELKSGYANGFVTVRGTDG